MVPRSSTSSTPVNYRFFARLVAKTVQRRQTTQNFCFTSLFFILDTHYGNVCFIINIVAGTSPWIFYIFLHITYILCIFVSLKSLHKYRNIRSLKVFSISFEWHFVWSGLSVCLSVCLSVSLSLSLSLFFYLVSPFFPSAKLERAVTLITSISSREFDTGRYSQRWPTSGPWTFVENRNAKATRPRQAKYKR